MAEACTVALKFPTNEVRVVVYIPQNSEQLRLESKKCETAKATNKGNK